MSEYTVISLVANEDYENSVTILELGTTPSRGLGLPYTNGEDTPFTKELLEYSYDHYNEEMTNWENCIKRRKRELEILNEQIKNAQNKEVYDAIYENIIEANNSIDDCKEYIDEIKHCKDLLSVVKFVMNYNKDNKNIKFVYTRG